MGGLIITRMVINMDESRLTTIAQIEDFLSASASIEFKPDEDDCERYAHKVVVNVVEAHTSMYLRRALFS